MRPQSPPIQHHLPQRPRPNILHSTITPKLHRQRPHHLQQRQRPHQRCIQHKRNPAPPPFPHPQADHNDKRAQHCCRDAEIVPRSARAGPEERSHEREREEDECDEGDAADGVGLFDGLAGFAQREAADVELDCVADVAF